MDTGCFDSSAALADITFAALESLLVEHIEGSMMVQEDLKVYGSRKVLWEPIYFLDLELNVSLVYIRIVLFGPGSEKIQPDPGRS